MDQSQLSPQLSSSPPALRRTTYLRKSMTLFGRTNEQPVGQRFLLWVDAVGGFLVCLADEVTIGQPDPQRGVDVPILGDLSARHIRIRRDAEGYLAQVRRPIKLNGRVVEDAAPLPADCELEAGAGVRLRFRRPHPLSATAQLFSTSRHRTQPSTDGVLLMAESLVLGPGPQCHIHCPTWTREVILYRVGAGPLWCRAAGTLEIDGRRLDGCGPVSLDSHVTGDDFSLSLEAL